MQMRLFLFIQNVMYMEIFIIGCVCLYKECTQHKELHCDLQCQPIVHGSEQINIMTDLVWVGFP